MNALTPRQKRALPALAAAPSAAEGCRLAGISRNAFYKWLQDPTFVEELDYRRNALAEEALRTDLAAVAEAKRVQVELLKSGNESIRLRAVMSILDAAEKDRERADIKKRLAALERDREEVKEPKE